jgi:phage host-nuclease inhibitor protein Gam
VETSGTGPGVVRVGEIVFRGTTMSRLYELTERYNNLLALLEDETIDSSAVNEAVNSLEEELIDKAQSIAKILKNIEGDIAAFKAEEKRLKEARIAKENKYNGLKACLEDNLKRANIDKVAGIVPLGFRKCPPSVEIVDPKLIPVEYIKPHDPEFNKQAILSELNAGNPVAGAKLVTDRLYLKIG